MSGQNQESLENMRDRMRKEKPQREYDLNYVGAKIDELLGAVNDTNEIVEKGVKKQQRTSTFIFGYGIGFAAIGVAASLASIPTDPVSVYVCLGIGFAVMFSYGIWYRCCKHGECRNRTMV